MAKNTEYTVDDLTVIALKRFISSHLPLTCQEHVMLKTKTSIPKSYAITCFLHDKRLHFRLTLYQIDRMAVFPINKLFLVNTYCL